MKGARDGLISDVSKASTHPRVIDATKLANYVESSAISHMVYATIGVQYSQVL